MSDNPGRHVQCGLADRRETNKTHRGNTSTCNIETNSAAATATAGVAANQLTLQLGELGTQLAQMVGCSLVFLRACCQCTASFFLLTRHLIFNLLNTLDSRLR